MRIILASASPRRRELLTQMDLTFEVVPSKGEEIITKQSPSEVVMELAEQKAGEIARQFEGGSGKDSKRGYDKGCPGYIGHWRGYRGGKGWTDFGQAEG